MGFVGVGGNLLNSAKRNLWWRIRVPDRARRGAVQMSFVAD